MGDWFQDPLWIPKSVDAQGPESALCNFQSASIDSTNVVLYSTIFIFLNPHISGPAQFKPMLFKSQLFNSILFNSITLLFLFNGALEPLIQRYIANTMINI